MQRVDGNIAKVASDLLRQVKYLDADLDKLSVGIVEFYRDGTLVAKVRQEDGLWSIDIDEEHI